jgi:hypothetical protein
LIKDLSSALTGTNDGPLKELLLKKRALEQHLGTKTGATQPQAVDVLTFDFLMDLAKELSEKDSMMMLGAGAKGTDPLVFQDGGKSYRAFLEGRVKEDGFVLLMHLSNLELKGIL